MEPERGHRVTATVKCIKGTCNAGHKVGDVINVSARNTAGMCGYLYHAAHPTILMLQFGGNVPWGPSDTVELHCPDPLNLLTVEFKRGGDADDQTKVSAGSPDSPALESKSNRSSPKPPEEFRPSVRFGRVVCRVE
jgi:uncharacterized repeat protein (TIGR04076 family)